MKEGLTLREAMLADVAISNSWGKQPKNDFILSNTYQGRFDSHLRNFQQQDLSFDIYVVARMADAATGLGHWISEGWLRARDIDGDIPAALDGQIAIKMRFRLRDLCRCSRIFSLPTFENLWRKYDAMAIFDDREDNGCQRT